MDNNSLAYRTLKNVSYGFLSFAIPILFSVFITPVIVKRLGVTDYGVYILANTIIGFLGLLDLGLTGGLNKYITEYYSQKNNDGLKKIMDAANSLYWLIGLFGLAVFAILGKFFLPIFHIQGLSQTHILAVFLLAGMIFFVNSANSVYTTVPAALQRFDIVHKINLAQLAFFNIGALILVVFGFQLKAIMLANLLTLLVLSLAFRIYSKKLLPQMHLGFSWQKQEFKKMYGFGIFAALADISISAVNNLDRLLIPIFLGPVQLSYYSLPGNVAQKTTTVTGSLGGMFFPLSTSLFAQGQIERLGLIFRRIVRNLSVLAAATTVSIMLFGHKILQYWLSTDFAEAGAGVLLVLAPTYYILALFGTLYNFLLGTGKQKFLAFWSVAMALINVILLILFMRPFGIIGAAWAYLLSALPILYLFVWIEKKVFSLQGTFKFYVRLYGKLLFTSGIFCLAVKYAIMGMVNSLASLIIAGPLSVLLFLALYKFFGFVEAEDWQLFRAYFLQIKGRVLGSSS